MPDTQLTAEETTLLTAAILQASVEGDTSTAEYLAGMATDPETLRSVLGSTTPSETEPQVKLRLKGGNVPPSPFRKQ